MFTLAIIKEINRFLSVEVNYVGDFNVSDDVFLDLG